ncbi:MAG: hypothetical protein WC467_00680 [Patescibacteria group bacterium]
MNTRKIIHYISHNFLDYLLLSITLIAIYGAGIYYLYALNWGSIILVLLLTIASFWALHKHLFSVLSLDPSKVDLKSRLKLNAILSKLIEAWPVFIFFVFSALSFYFLYKSRSSRALISPWQVMDYRFYFSYALSSLSLIYVLTRQRFHIGLKLSALSLYYFLSLSLAAIIYKIGYGYDPFIHQATMELIDKHGLVTPKPFYYLGEYSLIVIIHKLSGLSIYLLNKFLVPVLAALYLPLSIYRLTRKTEDDKAATRPATTISHWLSPLFILILTFSPFIATTPQNLSYLFLILTIIFGLTKKKMLWPFLLALATLAIHPLTGIPALGWCLALSLYRRAPQISPRRFHTLRFFLFLTNALVLPLALFISGGSNFKKLAWNFHFILDPLKNLFLTLNSAGAENYLLNFVYFFIYNYNLWLILGIAASVFVFFRLAQKTPEAQRRFRSLIAINSALALAYLVSSQIVFTDLINYEQTNFAARLLIIITLFFLPFLVAALNDFIALILRQDRMIKYIWLAFGLAFLMSSLYMSYPRIDKYFNSRGYSTSQNDIAAVNLIAAESTGSYIVLANQQVSAAALQELGFDHYYDSPTGPIFFYPIPTGGPLYQFYLDMVYKNPSSLTMASARSLAGVKESYLVVNKYWFQSDRIIAAAKLTADSWQSIDDEVYIFKY